MPMSLARLSSCLLLTASTAAPALAAPRGSEFDATLAPVAGGLEGVSAARFVDPVAALFSNPATLTQLDGQYAFSFGAAFVGPNLEASGGATDLFGGPANLAPLTGPFDGDSRNTFIGAPVFGALNRVNDKLVVGAGISAVSGLGGDFRNEPGLPNLISDLKVFGANASFGYELTDRISVGATFQLGLGALELGLTDGSGVVNDIGFGGSVGASYDAGPVLIGAAWEAPLNINYDAVLETAPDVFSTVELDQPQEFIFGIASTDSVFENTFVAFEFRHKDYSSASTYQDIWQSNSTFSFAGEHTMGPWALRLGYTYYTQLLRDEADLGSTFGGFSFVSAPDDSGVIPITATFLQLAQVTVANGYWSQSISGGIGFNYNERIRFDVNGSFGFDGEEQAGPFVSDATIYHFGGGITWSFK
ncbi:MAG: OmpP1/FadL family transporter [Maricaulaceae bacterium]